MADSEFTAITLRVPDPSLECYPVGWWENTALPILSATESWDELDEMEAQLLAMASFIESKGRDSIELEKALRIVEKRRGDMLEPFAVIGRPKQIGHAWPTFYEDTPDRTRKRYRTIAQYWDDLIYPHLLRETNRRAVTQTALLNLIASKIANGESVNTEFHWIQAVGQLRVLVERRIETWPEDAKHLAPKALRELADILEHEAQRAS